MSHRTFSAVAAATGVWPDRAEACLRPPPQAPVELSRPATVEARYRCADDEAGRVADCLDLAGQNVIFDAYDSRVFDPASSSSLPDESVLTVDQEGHVSAVGVGER